jgi:hypothetical protein
MAKNIDNDADAVLQHIENRFDVEKPLSPEEREQIIQFVISTQMIEGFELDYDRAAELIDKAYALPMPVLE